MVRSTREPTRMPFASPTPSRRFRCIALLWEVTDYTAQTNHFDLGPGQSVQLVLDLSQCSEDYLGGLLYFGYRSTKNSSRPLTRQDGVLLEIMEFGTLQALDPSDYEGTSDMGFVYIELDHSSLFVLSAVNTNRRKTIRLRLRASCGL